MVIASPTEEIPVTLEAVATRLVSVPTEVILGWAAVCTVPVGSPVKLPTKVVAVTTPANVVFPFPQ